MESLIYYISGSILLGSWFSKSYLSELKSFKYLFGYLTFLVTALMIYNILKQRKKKTGQSKKEGGADAVPARENGKPNIPSIAKFSVKKIDFRCADRNYSVQPAVLFAAGFLIAAISSVFGVGGGFLIVPFLTDVIGLPIFLAAGISILVVLISSLTSVTNYIRMGVPVIVPVLTAALAGVIIGSIIGPKISRHLDEKMLKYILMVLLVFVGVFYVFKP